MANDSTALSAGGPRWLTPELLVVVAFVASTACLAAALTGTQPSTGRAAAAGIVATAVVAGVLARLALRRDGRAHELRCLTGVAIAGVLVWGLVFALREESALGMGLALGATIGLPASIAAGVVLALFVRAVRSVRMFPTLDSLERVGIVAGACAGLAGAVSMGFVAPALLAVPIASAVLGLGMLALTWRRDVRRAAWLRDVYAGKAEGFAIVPLDETQIQGHIEPLVPGAAADAVLVRDVVCSDNGPYRVVGRPRAVALAPRDAAPSVAPIRTRVHRTALLFTLTLGLGTAAAIAQAERARVESSAQHAPPPARIACEEARSVFEYRARQVPPVTRALFLTHAVDEAIPAGEGYLYLATADGTSPSATAALQVLDAVSQIPCAGMPLVSTRAPFLREFGVIARLSIDQGENPALVATWVRKALEFAFRPSDTSAHESVQFGYYDRRVRWRVAAAISQTEGVRSYELAITGGDDIVLAPAELARLGEVTLIDAANGNYLDPSADEPR
jgi:hypothetical protein